MDYLPIFLKLKHQPCLIVGAGEVAARKLDLLLKAGSHVTVVAPHISNTIRALQPTYPIQILQQDFSPELLAGYKLVVAATNNEAVNQQVAASANAQGILVNVVDQPALCSFIFPAIIDRSPIVAAVSSGGAAPVLARLLRAKIETVISPAYGQLATLANQFRSDVKKQFKTSGQRKAFWEQVFQGNVAEQVFAGNLPAATTQLQQLLTTNPPNPIGEVYLIGAGPGAADLLTFRALRLMQQADVIVYDRLVSPEILELARRDAEKIYVGKQRQQHTLEQASINTLLATLALQGKRVARVKGGDPFIFGRGGEEIETLMQQGIPFQVVPGITAASGCASYAGIPLTHRDHAQSCIFVTGHLKDGSVNLNWAQLATPQQTIVIYMGSVGLEAICTALIAHGSPTDLPIALIQQGTTFKQKVITGTLATITDEVAKYNIQAPTLIIIGTVVNLHKQLAWFGQNLPTTTTQVKFS
jgi:uroporphyrin-III C-methyltransferase / precorrin-2 dehydrogenase / sirohydrochlorin ferrochelatase